MSVNNYEVDYDEGTMQCPVHKAIKTHSLPENNDIQVINCTLYKQ